MVRNPFQKDYDHTGRFPHYMYWSPEQEPDSTENFVGVLIQDLGNLHTTIIYTSNLTRTPLKTHTHVPPTTIAKIPTSISPPNTKIPWKTAEFWRKIMHVQNL